MTHLKAVRLGGDVNATEVRQRSELCINVVLEKGDDRHYSLRGNQDLQLIA